MVAKKAGKPRGGSPGKGVDGRRAPAEKRTSVRIDLLAPIALLHEVLTESLCELVFATTRVAERVREWTLYSLAGFWAAVILRAPASLTQAIEEALRGEGMGWPTIPATSRQAFFERCKDLRWEFFANLFKSFLSGILPKAKAIFCSELASLRDRFPEVWALDGSRLDAVAHRLKILWDVRSVVLPGCLEVAYDLFRGIPRILHFDPDAAKAESKRVFEILAAIPKGVLLLGDRLYASVALFEQLTLRHLWGVFRRNATLSLRKVKRLRRAKKGGEIIEDWLVDAGCGKTTPVQRLRWIRLRRHSVWYELLTNVLDPQRLSADEAIALYPCRWTIERLFFDLKEVLNLHCFYAANPNAVAMQVYAAALVYTAMRVAQAISADQVGVTPDSISTAKFFPRVAAAYSTWVGAQIGVRQVEKLNPDVRLRKPNWRKHAFASVPLADVLVEPRKGQRRKRRYCKARKHWKSFAHYPRGRKLIGR